MKKKFNRNTELQRVSAQLKEKLQELSQAEKSYSLQYSFAKEKSETQATAAAAEYWSEKRLACFDLLQETKKKWEYLFSRYCRAESLKLRIVLNKIVST